jgi:type IV pilus assembly protein PilX
MLLLNIHAEKPMSIAKKIMRRKNEGGFVLVASMLMLIVLAFMAVGMYRSFTTQENMSANTKEKGRTFQMAQSTLQYAEYQLLSSGLNVGLTDCTTFTTPPTADFVVCNSNANNNVLVTAPSGTTPWEIGNATAPKAAVQYDPTTDDSNITVSANSSGQIGQNTFSLEPIFYVQYLGLGTTSSCPSSPPKLYQITALAFGASNNTVAAVQSTYQLVPTVCNLGSS